MEVGAAAGVLGEAKRQARLALPIVFANLLYSTRLSVSLMFVGHLADHVFAGTALATSFTFVTGFSFMIGLSSALDTFCGQAYGAKEEASVGVHTQRAMLVLTALCVPISLVWCYAEPILVLIRQSPAISAAAAAYCRWLIPALFAFALMQCQSRFLSNQRVVVPLMLASLLCSAAHVPVCWLLVFRSGLGYRGAAMALSVNYCLNALLLALYIRLSPACAATWRGFSADAFRHVPHFFRLATSSALMLCLRFWTQELLVLLCGLLPNPKLETSAMSIIRNTSSILAMISIGFSTSTSIRVSNELGAGRPKEARKVIFIAFFIASFEGLGLSLLLILLRNVWGKVYSNETEVVKYVASIIPLLAISHSVDSIQCLFAGILSGCGLQKIGAAINIGAFYIIGVPISIVLGFVIHMRVKGFWIGFTSALCTQDLLCGILIFSINWENVAAKAKERIYTSIAQKENVADSEKQQSTAAQEE